MTGIGIARDYPQVELGEVPPREYDSNEILNAIGNVSIRDEDYLLIGGANLVLRGILRTTPDVDMLVSDKGFGVLAQELGAVLQDPPIRAQLEGARNRSVHLTAGFSGVPFTAAASMGNGYYPISFNSQKPLEELVKGVPSMHIEEVIASKAALSREKDIRHLAKIGHFLGRSIRIPSQPNIMVSDS